MENASRAPQLSKINTLNISMNEQEVVLGIAYKGDTELRTKTELAPFARTVLDQQVPFRPTRVLKLAIDRNEANLERIERALEGNGILRVSMKHIPDVARCLRRLKSEAVTIYQEKFDNEEQSKEFADAIFALKSVDNFEVELVFREYSEHSALFLSLLAERAHTIRVEIETWDKSEDQFIASLAPVLAQLLSQQTQNQLLLIKNQFAPFTTASIDFGDLCAKLGASQARRRLVFHVDEKPAPFVTHESVWFKVVRFQETFVAHVDSTGEDCGCYACDYNERVEAEAVEGIE